MRSLFLTLLLFVTSFALAHEIVLVTGATQGIGLQTAERLAMEGYVVYGTHRATSDMEAFNKAALRSRGRLLRVLMDVREENSIQKAVAEILQKEGKIDIVINNAGILLYGSLESTSIEQAEHIFDVNFFGPMRVIQAVLPHMRAQNKGHIVNITSQAAFRPFPSIAIYSSSKAALTAAAEALAVSLKPWNIKITCIEPGAVQTSMDISALKAARFPPTADPYLPFFEAANIPMKNNLATAQPVEEVVDVILTAVRSPQPFFRYQTSSLVKKQAALRARDVTGQSGLKELQKSFKPK